MDRFKKVAERRICIICEGFEEKEYLDKLIKCNIFSEKYDIKNINSKSIDNIIFRYQEKYQSSSYDIVLIFCDTDKTPSKKYFQLKQNINRFHGIDIASDLVIFGNPCTMQIILSHFENIKLKTHNKSKNAVYIEKLTNIKKYSAKEDQREKLFEGINKTNYKMMKRNVANLSSCEKDTPSTNVLKFFENLENENDNWIENILGKL